jgi:hypothetical protein
MRLLWWSAIAWPRRRERTQHSRALIAAFATKIKLRKKKVWGELVLNITFSYENTWPVKGTMIGALLALEDMKAAAALVVLGA